jgi:hypothetical protein
VRVRATPAARIPGQDGAKPIDKLPGCFQRDIMEVGFSQSFEVTGCVVVQNPSHERAAFFREPPGELTWQIRVRVLAPAFEEAGVNADRIHDVGELVTVLGYIAHNFLLRVQFFKGKFFHWIITSPFLISQS